MGITGPELDDENCSGGLGANAEIIEVALSERMNGDIL